jgi:hypothetical protein
MPGLVPGIHLRHRTKVGASVELHRASLVRIELGGDKGSSLADFPSGSGDYATDLAGIA